MIDLGTEDLARMNACCDVPGIPVSTPTAATVCTDIQKCTYSARGRKPCTRIRVDGTLFCRVHQPLTGERVMCSHCRQMIRVGVGVKGDGMKRHISHCSVATMAIPAYIKKGCNIVSFSFAENQAVNEIIENPTLNPATSEEMLAAKFMQLYDQYVRSVISGQPAPVDPNMQFSYSIKHRTQENALVKCITEKGLFTPSSAKARVEKSGATSLKMGPNDHDQRSYYLDFGAGKGSLTKAVGLSGQVDRSESVFVCIERSAYKHHAETNRYMQTSVRARVDIADVDLPVLLDYVDKVLIEKAATEAEAQAAVNAKAAAWAAAAGRTPCATVDTDDKVSRDGTAPVPEPVSVRAMGPQCKREVVGIGKHLCGNATDLALLAMSRLGRQDKDQQNRNGNSKNVATARGLCIATCCHGRCTWDLCVARPWLRSIGGLDAAEFNQLTHWSGMFSLAGHGLQTEKEAGDDDADVGADADADDDNVYDDVDTVTETVELTTSIDAHAPTTEKLEIARKAQEKADLGRVCKRLIDYGRLCYVRESLGLEGGLETYVDAHVSPENAALVAWTY